MQRQYFPFRRKNIVVIEAIRGRQKPLSCGMILIADVKTKTKRREACCVKYANTVHYRLQGVNPAGFGRLPDTRFEWKGERMKSRRLVQLYQQAGYPDYANRVEACATWLRFGTIGEKRGLLSANFCRLRLCPMCVARGARVRAQMLSRVMDAVQEEHKCQYIFLTLTIQNVPGDKLGEALDHLGAGWHRLVNQKPVQRAFKGTFRAIEITRNNEPDSLWYGTFHPHIHVIGTVEDGYFKKKNGLYLTKDDIIARWRKACRLDYDPSVDISKTYDKKSKKKPKGDNQASAGAVLEAAKYATKDSDYISDSLGDEEAAQVVADYTKALYKRRLTAFTGWMKETAKRLRADDLDNADPASGDDTIREDLAEMIEEYGWHFGAGDYVLARKFVNPLKVVRTDD